MVFAETTIHNIYETNSIFHVKFSTISISFSQNFLASIDKMFILTGRLGTLLTMNVA